MQFLKFLMNWRKNQKKIVEYERLIADLRWSEKRNEEQKTVLRSNVNEANLEIDRLLKIVEEQRELIDRLKKSSRVILPEEPYCD